MKITKEEQTAINMLKLLDKKWPDTLWIYVTGNGVHILKCGENGSRVYTERQGSPDLDYEVGYLTGISNDGGDF